MRKVCIIPARKGSKGIPNKNIRLLNGQPLICYSIFCAKNSSSIDEVYVSTDSPVVATIASTAGAKIIWRNDPQLSTDSATLDTVILSACQSLKLCPDDLVISLQATSPCLTAETLNSALSFFFQNQGRYDTVLAAINKPHLAWGFDAQKQHYVPLFDKRLNRQYLPPHLMETGAFVICKYQTLLQRQSRFGDNVYPFLVPENESVDIDNFEDFSIASLALRKNRVAFYVNGSNSIGLGHIYRSFEIADCLLSKPIFIYNQKLTNPVVFGDSTYPLYPVNSSDEVAGLLKTKGINLLINDVLDTDESYMKMLKGISGLRIINFEDSGPGAKLADCSINALLSGKTTKKDFYGPSYFVINKLFLQHPPITIRKVPKSVFICFGGADPSNYTSRLLSIVTKTGDFSNVNFYVVIGKSVLNKEKFDRFTALSNIHMFFDTSNISDIMCKCDVAITSRGRTAFELAYLGIPVISMAQNQNEEKHHPISHKHGFVYLGRNPSDQRITKEISYFLKSSSFKERKKMSKLLRGNRIEEGRKNVLSLIEGQML
jgi:CMP-N-acetylneuraminic acid synthetase/spore coat polysaccharide biosynthesis predicted glycosyltransferase SpsG